MIVKIKMNANIKYELTNTGMIKANSLMLELFKNEHITKQVGNVTECLSNLLYDGKPVIGAQYDMLTNEVELYLKEED